MTEDQWPAEPLTRQQKCRFAARSWKLLACPTRAKRTRSESLVPAIGGVGAASRFVVYEPVEVVFAAAVERERAAALANPR
jgi:hypothetical protein